MGIFDDRKRGFEEKFRWEQEFLFKVTARRNRLFGQWAAGGLGLSGTEAEEYTKSVLFADLQEAGDEDLLGKVEQDMSAKSMIMTRAQLRAKLDEFANEARAQIMGD